MSAFIYEVKMEADALLKRLYIKNQEFSRLEVRFVNSNSADLSSNIC